MFLQSNLIYEVKIGIEDLLGGMVREHTDKQGDNAFHDQGIALSLEMNLPLLKIRLQPHPTLTTVYQVLLRLVLFFQRFLSVAQVNEQLLLVHPVVETTEFLYNLVLNLVY